MSRARDEHHRDDSKSSPKYKSSLEPFSFSARRFRFSYTKRRWFLHYTRAEFLNQETNRFRLLSTKRLSRRFVRDVLLFVSHFMRLCATTQLDKAPVVLLYQHSPLYRFWLGIKGSSHWLIYSTIYFCRLQLPTRSNFKTFRMILNHQSIHD